jgi:hypothetical protein
MNKLFVVLSSSCFDKVSLGTLFYFTTKADATSIVSSIVNYCTREIRVASQRAEDAPVCLCAKGGIVNYLIVLDKKTAEILYFY